MFINICSQQTAAPAQQTELLLPSNTAKYNNHEYVRELPVHLCLLYQCHHSEILPKVRSA